mmetsp:Transcript_98382/g.228146  ORF Transcript_98382/g.228146 Transcript_98382/m.228146 type:complete len:363 (+) Transcript_98382:61-1149(+)
MRRSEMLRPLPTFFLRSAKEDVVKGTRRETLPSELHNFEDELALFNGVTDGRGTMHGHFFGTLGLSPGGGMAEVGTLFRRTRYFGLVLFVILFVANTRQVVLTDLRALMSQCRINDSALLIHEIYLRRFFNVTPEYLIALFELAWLAYHSVVIVLFFVVTVSPQALCPRMNPESVEYRRFEAVAILCKEFPQLQAFSAMRMLQYVTPAVMIPDFQSLVLRIQRRWPKKPRRSIMRLAIFVFLRLLYLFVGAEAFLVRFRITAEQLSDAQSSAWSLIPIFLFLNQALGIVQLNLFTNRRLFQFVFGGVDSFIDKPEERRMRVWNAAFQKAAWDSCKGAPHRFLALSLTFNDVDFQRLVLTNGS